MLVLFVAVVVYSIAATIERDFISSTGARGLIEEAKRAISDIERIIEEAQKPRPKKRRKVSRRKTPSKPVITKSLQLLVSRYKDSAFNVKTSRGGEASFEIVEGTMNYPDGFTLKLSVKELGAEGGADRFASGVIDFSDPVMVGEMRAIGIKVKGKGVKGFGLAALFRVDSGFLRWDFPNNPAIDKAQTFIIPFDFFDLWKYNTINQSYKRMNIGFPPEKIDQIQVYLKAEHLENGRSGELWIENLELRN